MKNKFLFLILNILKEPMLLLLIVCGIIYFILGSMEDALMLVSFIAVVIGITIYQERKTEKALDALKNLSSPRALVIREGIQVNIPGREVVTEDIIVLKEGNRVPADAIVFSCSNLLIDESMLTGESYLSGNRKLKKAANPGKCVPAEMICLMFIQAQ